jgi:hypothetical protein
VLEHLQKHDLYLRPEKCEFEKETIEYLGMVVTYGEVCMVNTKVCAVTDWPVLTNLNDLCGFVGFANFYRWFIANFSKICWPLRDLTKKDVVWAWVPAQQQVFETLKAAFTVSPVLAPWKPNLPTRLEVDASGYDTGAIISQMNSDGVWHPVAYHSEGLLPAERNYMVEDREMLAII